MFSSKQPTIWFNTEGQGSSLDPLSRADREELNSGFLCDLRVFHYCEQKRSKGVVVQRGKENGTPLMGVPWVKPATMLDVAYLEVNGW